MKDSIKNIFGSAKRFFTGTLLSRFSGLLRDIVTAFAFGTQPSLAAFLEAFRFAHLLRRLFGEGALQTVFAPHYEKLRQEDPLRASSFFQDLCASLSFLLLIVIGLAMGALGIALIWGELSSDNNEVVWLTFLMMPSLLFICLFGINASLLQCERSFFTSSAAPVLFNLTWIAGAFLLRHCKIETAMSGLSGFIVAGCLLQWIITLPQTLRLIKSPFKTSIQLFSPDVRSLAKPLLLGMIGIAAAQINSACDVLFARYADNQGPAFLWYAIRLQQLPLALFGIALSNAILPPLARAAKSGNLENAKSFFQTSFLKSAFFMIPMTAALLILGDRCIDLIYSRGDFNEISTISTTYCLWGYAWGLVPMALILMTAPVFYAFHDYRTPTLASVVSMSLNMGLNALFIWKMGYGPASVAYATAISAWINLGILLKNLQFDIAPLLKPLGGALLAAAVSGGSLYLFDLYIFGTLSSVDILLQNPIFYSESFVFRTARLLVEGVLFLSLYYGSYWVIQKRFTQGPKALESEYQA